MPAVDDLRVFERFVAPSIPRRVTDIPVAQFDILKTRAAELRAAGHAVINLGQAVPGFGPPAAALDAAAAALQRPDTHVYSPDAGLPELRAALCHHLSTRHRIEATPEDVMITAGGNQAFLMALMTLVDPGAEVLLPAPFFMNHEMAVRAIGAVPVEVRLAEEDGFVLRWHQLERHVSPRTRVLVVCTPSNPTGAVVDPADMPFIVREMARRDIVVLSDETYMDFVYRRSHWSVASLPDWRANVVLIGTFSKAFGMTGWRVGYAVADRSVMDEALKIQDTMIICAPVISQIAATAALREAADHAAVFKPGLLARQSMLAERIGRIPQLRWRSPGAGFFAFVHAEGCTDSRRLCADLLEQAHVVTVPGAIFGHAGEGYLRLSYGAASIEDLNEACNRLERFFAR